MIKEILLVGAGSFVGGVLRYLVSCFVRPLLTGVFPWATLTVNLLGCFLIGLIGGLLARHGANSGSWSLLLTTGLCGGFTTFSTFANEGLSMLGAGHYAAFGCYVAVSVVVGLALCGVGYWVANL